MSSDSDFTRLAQRLREEGLTVYGFGEQKTPDAFVQACDKFIYTEVLRSEASAKPTAPVVAPKPVLQKPAAPKKAPAAAKTVTSTAVASAPATMPAAVAASEAKNIEPLPLALILQAIEEASDESGWAFLGTVGSYLNKIRPDFDPRLYGHRKLSDLFKQPKHFAVEERGVGGSSNKTIYIARWVE